MIGQNKACKMWQFIHFSKMIWNVTKNKTNSTARIDLNHSMEAEYNTLAPSPPLREPINSKDLLTLTWQLEKSKKEKAVISKQIIKFNILRCFTAFCFIWWQMEHLLTSLFWSSALRSWMDTKSTVHLCVIFIWNATQKQASYVSFQ